MKKKENANQKKKQNKSTFKNLENIEEKEEENLDNKEKIINNVETKKLESEEENKLDKEFNEFIEDNSDSLEYFNNDEEQEKEEMKDIIDDFLDIPIIKDNYLLKKKNNITDIEQRITLNNQTNPFIKEIAKTNEEVKNENNDYDNNEIEEEIEIPNKEEDEQILKLNKLFIIEMNLIGDKKQDNFYYQNIKYANKKFNASYTKKEGLKHNIIYYYCKYHRTTKKVTYLPKIIKKIKFLYVMGKLNMIK